MFDQRGDTRELSHSSKIYGGDNLGEPGWKTEGIQD